MLFNLNGESGVCRKIFSELSVWKVVEIRPVAERLADFPFMLACGFARPWIVKQIMQARKFSTGFQLKQQTAKANYGIINVR